MLLTHWGRATHICISKLTTIGLDNDLSPGRRQAIIWTIAGILLIGPLGTNFSEILIGIQTFSFNKMHLKMASVKWRSSCLGLNVLRLCKGTDCQLVFCKTVEIPTNHMSPKSKCDWRQSQPTYLDKPVRKGWCQPIWRPCFIHHWQS